MAFRIPPSDEIPVPVDVQVLSTTKWPSLTFLDTSMNEFEAYDVTPRGSAYGVANFRMLGCAVNRAPLE